MTAATKDLYDKFMAANAADEAIPEGVHPSDRLADMLSAGLRRGEVERAKRLANLKAHAALHGIVLNATDNDAGRPVFIVSEWAHTQQLDSLEAVADWLMRRTGIAA